MIYWFFGIPGSGKTHVGAMFSAMTGIPQYEADDFHTASDRRVIAKGAFTLERRHRQLERIAKFLKSKKITDAIITHPLPDEKSRVLLAQLYKNKAIFVHIQAPLPLVKKRLGGRRGHHFTADLLDVWIPKHWQTPKSKGHIVIKNNVSKMKLKAQLTKLSKAP